MLRVLKRIPPVPGNNLYLTLDSRLQAASEKAFGDYAGSAIALDPKTGDILAMVSLPAYDPNPFVNGIEYADYTALREDDKEPLFNRALRGQYPPGSIVKPFIGLAGLEQGVTGHKSSTYCPGFYTLPGSTRKYRDWKRTGHGTVKLDEAITQSCDVYFYDLALSMGIDRIHDYLQHFGFGKRTGIDIQGELPGLLPSPGWKRARRGEPWFPGETVITGIGQGFFLSTPLQLAVATATLANQGQRVKPKIIYTAGQAGSSVLQTVSRQKDQIIAINDPAHWDRIIASMVHVVHGERGTARHIGSDSPYRIAGKTGTAQVFGLKEEEEYDAEAIAEKLRDHALFIAFAPVDDPQIVVAIIVEHGGSGGAIAAPIARSILDSYLLDEAS